MSTLTFTPIDRDAIPKSIVRTGSKAAAVLNAFLAATNDEGNPVESAQIEVPEGAKLETVQGGLTSYVRAHKVPVQVMTRSGAIYLIRLTPEQAEEYWSRTRVRKNGTAETATEDEATAEPEAETTGRKARRAE